MKKHSKQNHDLSDKIGWLIFFALIVAIVTFIVLRLFIFKPKDPEPDPAPATPTSSVTQPAQTATTKPTEPAPDPDPNDNPDQPETTDSGNENNQSGDGNSNPKRPAQYEGGSPSASTITGSITHAAIDSATKTLQIRVNIDQYIENGTCNLSMSTANGDSLTRSVPTVTNPSSSSCQGFDIPVDSDGLNQGDWSVKVVVSSGSTTGTFETNVKI